jgi:hypothetical protein
MSEKQAWALNGLVGVSPGGYAPVGSHFSLTVDEATDLIYQLATAIEEAKRHVDPFERWWQKRPVDPAHPEYRFVTSYLLLKEHEARDIISEMLKSYTEATGASEPQPAAKEQR